MRFHLKSTLPLPLLALTLALAATGCFSHSPEWRYRGVPGDADLEAAERLSHGARDAAGVEAAINAWEGVLAAASGTPESRRALVALADLELLHGAAYAEGRGAKKRRYRRALERSESALYTFPALRARVDRGEPLWTAVDAFEPGALDEAERDVALAAMTRWFTALFYTYRDCLGPLGKVANLRWLDRARAVLERASTLDADWGDGVLHFSWAIYYLALPESVGGDRARSAAEFERAIELGPRRLLLRWGRGRYFHVERGDRAAFEADLRWVLEQDPESVADPARWAVYFQREAEALLARADELF